MKLKAGDGIGVFSPSSPISATVPIRYQRGKAYLEERGFKVIDGCLTGCCDVYRSGMIKERATEFNQLLYDDRVKCIMASIGGMNSNSLLPYLDYDYLKLHPKIIIGYSDVTALLLGIYAKCGITTYYGPALASSFGEFPPLVDETFRYFSSVLMQDWEVLELKMPKEYSEERIDWSIQNRAKVCVKNDWLVVNEGIAKGRLIGGNLNTMEGIFGSEYMPTIQDGDILLIEDSLKDLSVIERSFSLLKVNGVFDKLGGLILGKHEGFEDFGSGRRPLDVLGEVLGDVKFPILAEFDCCHTHPMFTMPIGCQCELDTIHKRVIIMR